MARKPRTDKERKYQTIWHLRTYHANRRAYLKGKGCEICGKKRNLYIKKRNGKQPIQGYWSYSKKRREEFLKDTIILCHWHYLEKITIAKGWSKPLKSKAARLKRISKQRRARRKKKKLEIARIRLQALGFKVVS